MAFSFSCIFLLSKWFLSSFFVSSLSLRCNSDICFLYNSSCGFQVPLFFSSWKKKWVWETATVEILRSAVRHTQASTAVKTQNRFFTFHKNSCRKTCGKVKCTLDPTCIFDQTEIVDLVTSWIECACHIEVNEIWSVYIDGIQVTTVKVGFPLVHWRLHPISFIHLFTFHRSYRCGICHQV